MRSGVLFGGHRWDLLDEAHAFADLLAADGDRVVASTAPFTTADLARAAGLVIANALGTDVTVRCASAR